MHCKVLILSTAISLSLAAGPAIAHGDAPKAGGKVATKAEQMPFGVACDPKKVTRTINMDALDTLRYSPSMINAKLGETIRFVMHNKGRIMHEIVIGTPAGLKEHSALMKKFPTMEHDAPHMLHVAPGKKGEMVWEFNRAGSFTFACLIAGHFEAGMAGTIVVS